MYIHFSFKIVSTFLHMLRNISTCAKINYICAHALLQIEVPLASRHTMAQKQQRCKDHWSSSSFSSGMAEKQQRCKDHWSSSSSFSSGMAEKQQRCKDHWSSSSSFSPRLAWHHGAIHVPLKGKSPKRPLRGPKRQFVLWTI